MLISLNIGRLNVKDYDIVISGRRAVEEIIQVMDVDSADTAIAKAEMLLAKKLGCEVSELIDVQVERCIYIDPGEEADYKNMGEQKTLRDIIGT
jgi:hypothetical protein